MTPIGTARKPVLLRAAPEPRLQHGPSRLRTRKETSDLTPHPNSGGEQGEVVLLSDPKGNEEYDEAQDC